MESKLITPKYITGTYFGAIVAIFNSIFTVCFLGVMLFLTPERAPKAGPATCWTIDETRTRKGTGTENGSGTGTVTRTGTGLGRNLNRNEY